MLKNKLALVIIQNICRPKCFNSPIVYFYCPARITHCPNNSNKFLKLMTPSLSFLK